MTGRLLRRKIVNVCEAEFDRMDRLEITHPHAVLCDIEIHYNYGPGEPGLMKGTGFYPITVEDYLNCWYWEDVRQIMRLFHKCRPYGARWEIIPAREFDARAHSASVALLKMVDVVARKYGLTDEEE